MPTRPRARNDRLSRPLVTRAALEGKLGDFCTPVWRRLLSTLMRRTSSPAKMPTPARMRAGVATPRRGQSVQKSPSSPRKGAFTAGGLCHCARGS